MAIRAGHLTAWVGERSSSWGRTCVHVPRLCVHFEVRTMGRITESIQLSVFAGRNVPEGPPVFSVFCRFARFETSHWSQGLELERMRVRKQFEITARIRIFCTFLEVNLLHKQMTIAEVCPPPGWISTFNSMLGMLASPNIFIVSSEMPPPY
jgi:hypothetical protein